MKETSVNKLPYPEDEDGPNGPSQIEALAKALDVLKLGSQNLKPTLGVKPASADTALATSYSDLTGAALEITPVVASFLAVVAVFEFSFGANEISAIVASGTLNFGGTDQTPEAILQTSATTGLPGGEANSPGARATVSQVYLLSLSAGAKATVKMRGKRGTAGGVTAVKGSRFLYALFAS